MTSVSPPSETAPRGNLAGRWFKPGLVVVAVCAAIVVASAPARITAARQAATAAETRLASLRDSLRAFDARRRHSPPEEPDTDSVFARAFSASSADSEAATLAAYVGDASRRAGIRAQAVESVPDRATAGALGRPRVRLTGVADASGIAQFLLLLELEERLARAVELRVEADDVFASADTPERLRLVVLVEGLALRRGTE